LVYFGDLIGFIPQTMSHQMIRLCLQWWSSASQWSPCSLIYRAQTKTWTIRSLCQTPWWCPSKPDTPHLLWNSRRCLAIIRLEASSRPTSHYLDSSDPPRDGNTDDWCSEAGSWQIVLATNHNGRTHYFM